MAKGLAVVSGSSDVVFKALETGIVTIGSSATDAEVTLTGSLTINKHADGGDPLIITGLSSSAVSAEADKVLVIDATTGVVREADKLSASDVQLADGQTVEQFSGSVDGRLDTLEASVGTGVLVVSGSTEIEEVDLAGGSVRFLGTASETDVTVTTSSAGNVVVTVGLVPDVTVNTLTASNGLLVSAGGATVTGNISGSGELQVGSNATVGGNLTVAGDFLVEGSVTTINTTNLTVEDAIILVGSGSDASSGELGIVFGSTNGKSLSLNAGEFYLGNTTDDTLDGNLDPDNDGAGILHLGALSASVGVNALQVEVGANGLTVAGDTTLNGAVTLGDAASDAITINGYITGSGSPIVVSSSLTVGDAGNVNSEVTTFVSQVRMPIYTLSGDALEGTFPAIPAAYISSPTAQGGHMFYLTASTNVGLGDDSVFPEANKWYMNERGVWHESFFFTE